VLQISIEPLSSTVLLLSVRGVGIHVQAAPRDALISDLAPKESRSACYGFAQSMRKWGSFVGAGLSFFLMKVRSVRALNHTMDEL